MTMGQIACQEVTIVAQSFVLNDDAGQMYLEPDSAGGARD